jgi:hypothetical protein
VKTSQVHAFFADTKRLWVDLMFLAVELPKPHHIHSGIQNFVTRPPHTLTDALCREIEKYDQICDLMEAQLVKTTLLFYCLTEVNLYISRAPSLCFNETSTEREPRSRRKERRRL